MPDERIGNLDAKRTIYTVLMSAITKHIETTGVNASGATTLVRDIMDDLFKPGWYWAIRAVLNGESGEPPAEGEATVDPKSAVTFVVRDVIDKHQARTGLSLRDSEIEQFMTDFNDMLFHPAFIPAIRDLCDQVMMASAGTKPLEVGDGQAD